MKFNAMNETRKSDKDAVEKRLLSITAEEFDAKFDAGEDISDYVDWDHGVLIKPGELSPGQKLSIQMLAEAQAHDDANSEPVPQPPLQVFLPTWAYDRVQHEAIKKGVSEEERARLLIVRQLEQEKVSS